MGSSTMAVKLILVSLVLLAAVCSSHSLAQQSSETGGRRLADRRTQLLKRIQGRRNVEKSLNNNRKISASEDDLAKRKQLFQRNPLRRRKPVNTRENKIIPATQKSTLRTSPRKFKTTHKPFTPTHTALDIEPAVKRISNSDRNIQNLVLQKTVEAEVAKTPFIGTSEVKTLSNPSGFRSSNEQINRISFKKKPTTQAPIIVEEVELRKAPRRKLFKPRTNGLKSSRPSIVRNKEKTNNSKIAFVKNDALQALLRTASDTEQTEKPKFSTEVPKVKDMPIKVQDAMLSMEEDNLPTNTRAENPRKLNALLKRVNRFRSRSRGRGNVKAKQEDKEQTPVRETPRRITNFRSFPQRAKTNIVRGSSQARPVSSVRPQQTTRKPSSTLPRFREINVPTPSPIAQPPLIEDIRPRTEIVTVEFTDDELYPEGKEKFFADNGIFLTLEDAEEEARKRNQQVLSGLQNQFSNEAPRSKQTFQTPTAQFQPTVNNQFQQQPATVQQAAQLPPRINSASQSQFGLLNTNNFQSFDAQFGGAVPVNPGSANLNSNIFTRPQVQGQQQFPARSPVQQQVQSQVPQFQTQNQPAAPQLEQQQQQQPVFNVPSSRFFGHPADNINLNTGSFSLNTGK